MKIAQPIANILECHWRSCLLAYMILAAISSTFALADLKVHDKIDNSHQKEKRGGTHSKPSSHLHKNNHESRRDNTLIHDGHAEKSAKDKGSPELRRFLEDVLKAQKDLKWIDRAVHAASHEYIAAFYKLCIKSRRLDENFERVSPKAHQDHNVLGKNDDNDEEYLHPDFHMRDPRKSQTSLESLKKTVLELRKNLVEGEKKSSQSKKHVNNREHDKKGLTENRKSVSSNHAMERESNPQEAMPYSSLEDIGKRSNSWDDPNPSAEGINFDKDNSELRNHEHKNDDSKMWGLKEAKINREQKEGNVKLFHRAGFGELYPEEQRLEDSRGRERRDKGHPLEEDRYISEHQDKDKLENRDMNLLSKPSSSITSSADGTHRSEEESDEAQINPSKPIEIFHSALDTNVLDHANENQVANVPKDKDIMDIQNVDSNDSKKNTLKTMGDQNSEDTERRAEESHEQSDVLGENDSRRKRRKKQPMKGEASDGDFGGDSSRISGFTTNESQAACTKVSENTDDERTGAEAEMLSTKVNREDFSPMELIFKPQEHFYGCEKKVQKAKPDDEERRKVPQQIMDEKRGEEVPKNLTFLLESENRDLIEVSGASEDHERRAEKPGTLVLNSVDVRKKMIMKDSSGPGNSVSTIVGIKIQKAQIGTSANTKGNQGWKDDVERDKPFLNSTVTDFDLPNNMEFQNNNKYVKMSGDAPEEEAAGKQNSLVKKMETLDHRSKSNIGSSVDSEGPTKDSSKSSDEFTHKSKILEASNVMLNDIRPMDRSCTQRRLLWSLSSFANDSEDTVNINLSPESRFLHGYAKTKRRLLESKSDNVDIEKQQDDDDWSGSAEDVAEAYDEEEDETNDGENENADVERQERSLDNPAMDPIKAKVDVLIKQKLSMKNKESGGYMRKRRNPMNTIEYYDYDNEADEQDRNPAVLNSKEQRIADNHDRDSIESQIGLDFRESSDCKLGLKKNEHAEETLKEEREKERRKHKRPKEEFIGDLRQSEPKNETGKNEKSSSPSNASPRLEFGSEGKLLEADDKSRNLEQGEENTNDINHGRLEELRMAIGKSPTEKKRVAGNENAKLIAEKSLEYILSAQRKIDSVGDFLQSIEPLATLEDIQLSQNSKDAFNNPEIPRAQDNSLKHMEKNEPNDVETIYDESENVPDWNDSEMKYKPRLKGDQRTDFENGAKSEMQNSGAVSNNVGAIKQENVNLSPILSVQTSVKEQQNKVAEAEINTTPAVNITKCPKTHGNHQDRFREPDSKFSQNSQVYLEPAFPHEVIPNKNRGGQTDFGSEDLQESFVEPLDWFDDSDDDMKVRLSRGLRSMEISAPLELADWKNTRSITDRNNLTSSKIFNSQSSDKSFGSENVTDTALTTKRDIVNISNRVRREISKGYRDRNRVEINAPDFDKYSMNSLQQDYNFPRSKIFKTSRVNNYRTAPNLDRFEEDRYRVNIKDKRDRHGNSKADKILELRTKNRRAKGKKKKHSSKASRKLVKKDHLMASNRLHAANRRNRRHKHYPVLKASRRRDHAGKLNKKRKSKRVSSHYAHPLAVQKSRRKKKKHSRRTTKNENLNEDARIANKEVILESAARRHTAKFEDDSQRRKIAMLLTADDPEDESQMESALHGELAGNIVDKIFQQVQNNEALKVALGPGLYRKHKPEDAIAADKVYRKALDEDEVKHTEDLMKRVMELLGRLILDEVQRKTCVSLSPDLQVFLEWILGVGQKRQGPAASLLRDEEVPGHREDQKFLFNDSSDEARDVEIDELHKKIRVMESLIEEYNALTEREKTRVRSVHEYLIKQLDSLLKYIEAKEAAAKSLSRAGLSRRKIRTSLEQQKISNGTLNWVNMEHFDDHLGRSRAARRYIRSSNAASRSHSKHKRHEKRKKKHRKHQKGKNNAGRSSKRRMQVHKELQPRRKRANSNEDLSDTFNSAYEKPMIYNPLGIRDVGAAESAIHSVNQRYERIADKSKENYWEEVFAHKPGINQERTIERSLRNEPLIPKGRIIKAPNEAQQISGKQGSLRISTSGGPFRSLEDGNGVIDQHHALERQRAIHHDKGQNAVHKCLMNHNVDIVNRCGTDGGCSNDHRPGRNGQNVRDGRSIRSNDEYLSNYLIKKREIPRSSRISNVWGNHPEQVRRTLERKSDFAGNVTRKSDNSFHALIGCKGEAKKEPEIKVSPTLTVRSNVSNNEQDVLPIKGKNQVEDEVILLNKREAWKRENEEQLEEVAFGKDMSKRMREKELFERLTEIDKRKNINGTNATEKRENNKQDAEGNTLLPFGLLPKAQNGLTSTTSRGVITFDTPEKQICENKSPKSDSKNIFRKNCKASNDNGRESNASLDDEKVRILEKMTNVYPDIEQSTATI
ncbi:hypothetical protein KM043_008110 [Ampulex compressa]|nr:hypothetical protein KM043_008110 [Ampulex compressa]